MNQQTLLRQAMQQASQTRAQMAAALGVSPRTLDKWLLPETSKDFRHMPETAARLLASQYGLRKSAGLSLPYDWSNPAMPDDALILAVLRRAVFTDIVRTSVQFGLARVNQLAETAVSLVPENERPILARILNRMLRSIEIAQSQHEANGMQINSSFPRRRESSALNLLDSRLRGNDKVDLNSVTPSV